MSSPKKAQKEDVRNKKEMDRKNQYQVVDLNQP